jgi:YHS domain-containing protein
MTISRRMLLLSMSGASLALPAFAAEGGPPEGRRIALSGYDPMAYFEDGKPEKGVREFWYSFDDVIYIFRSSEHRAKFAANPERYAPQYNGYCAAGVSKGYKAEPDPEAWAIAGGRLFVFQLKDRVPDFKKNIAGLAAQADTNWPRVKNQ